MSEKCCCFGAGGFFGLYGDTADNALIIAADGGLNAVRACGLTADVVIGDFDSLGEAPEGENVIRLPAEKDTTDMLEAVKAGERRGCRVFHLYGGTGGRLDHTIANIQLLGDIAARGMSGFLYGDGFALTALSSGGKIKLSGKSGAGISVFALSEKAEGVTLSGLKYELNGHTLTNTFPLGVSNEFTGRTAEISVKNGLLLIYYTYERNDTV